MLIAPGAPAPPTKDGAREVVRVPPSAFADTWAKRPRTEQQIGLRLVGDDILDTARAAAAKIAHEVHDDTAPTGRLDAYTEALIRTILAHACVKPDDVRSTWFGPAPEDLIAIALTDDGLLLLWEAFERMKVRESPLPLEAEDEELDELVEGLRTGEFWRGLDARDMRVVRRYLKHAIDEADSRRT